MPNNKVIWLFFITFTSNLFGAEENTSSPSKTTSASEVTTPTITPEKPELPLNLNTSTSESNSTQKLVLPALDIIQPAIPPVSAQSSITTECQTELQPIKEQLLSMWLKTFDGIINPDIIASVFSSEKIKQLSAKNTNEACIEIFSKLQQLNYPKLFKNNHNLVEILSPSLPHFFKACCEFIELFPLLKEKYDQNGKNAGILIQVSLATNIKQYDKISNLWNYLLNICSNLKDVDDCELIAQTNFSILKPAKRTASWPNIQYMIDYVYAQKAMSLYQKNLQEYNDIKNCLENMNEAWVTNNNWLVNVLCETNTNPNISPDIFVSTKIKFAKEQIEKALKHTESLIKDLSKKCQKLDKKLQDLVKPIHKTASKKNKTMREVEIKQFKALA